MDDGYIPLHPDDIYEDGVRHERIRLLRAQEREDEYNYEKEKE